jgi:eukaryotic-like serine/threonine-protein kinase
MGCAVAVKTFRVPTPGQLVRLKKEFRALSEISHKNLLDLYELVVEGETCFFSMELVENGIDFTSWVTRNRLTDRGWVGSTASGQPPRRTQSVQPTVSAGYDADFFSSDELHRPAVKAEVPATVIKNPFASRIDLTRLRNATLQLTQGVLALHAAGKLHRDLKPSNVLVDKAGRVVILDFGLVDTIDSVEHQRDSEHRIIGTVQFMSPEQGWGETLTPASDWFAVGVMLYEALAGTLPFPGKTALQILYAKRRGAERGVRELAPGVPAELDTLVMGLLHPDPAKRFGGDELMTWARAADPGAVSREEDAIGPAPDAFVPRPTGPPSWSGLMAVLPFVGRDRELQELTSAVDAATHAPVVVHVRGISGMGKSELVRQWLLRLAGSTSACILRGRCNPQELIPYKAFDSVVDEIWGLLSTLSEAECEAVAPTHAAELTRLFPVLGSLPGFARLGRSDGARLDPHQARRRGFQAFRELMLELCARHPVVIWIDDLQWGDLDSLRMLSALLAGADPPRLCLLLSYRAEDVGTSPVLTRLLSEEGPVAPEQTKTLHVEPLSPADSRGLLRQLANLHDLEWTDEFDAMVDDAGGSPFFLSEFVRAVAAATQAGASPAPAPLFQSARAAHRTA